MDPGNFGSFAQQMFNAGLVFNITFTGEEVQQIPRWNSFDEKIMAGISTLAPEIELPPRPPKVQPSANATLWIFLKFHPKMHRSSNNRSHYLSPPPIAPQMYTPETLIDKIAEPNPISTPDNAPCPQHLIIIGQYTLSMLFKLKYLCLPLKAPRYPGFVKGNLLHVEHMITIHPGINKFGSHACFGYHILEGSFKSLGEAFHSIIELCGTPDLPCPQPWSRSPSPDFPPLFTHTRISSPKPKADTAVTPADCLSDEQFQEWLANENQMREKGNFEVPSGPSVISCSIPFLPPADYLILDVIQTVKANEKIQETLPKWQPRSSSSPAFFLSCFPINLPRYSRRV
jgi:hypothetical protein